MAQLSACFILQRRRYPKQFPLRRTAVKFEHAAFSSGTSIVMRDQLGYGACARPISMPWETIAAASLDCGSRVLKKMKFAEEFE